jgi:aspartate dehydrogenase
LEIADMQKRASKDLKLAIAGLGAIGMKVARAVDAGEVEGINLVAVSARDRPSAKQRVADFVHPPEIVFPGTLGEIADLVVECAPSSIFPQIAGPVIENGGCLLPLSVGALLNRMDLVERARETGARIIVPTGALIGLDTVRAMATGTITKVLLVTRKPPRGLAGAPHLVENDIEIDRLEKPLCVFRGSAHDAALGFPANVNVAAALALAGIGPDNTQVEVWADPEIDRNIQSVRIQSDSGEATMVMNNIPSDENPRTGKIVANSVIATLQRFTSPLIAGT